jgi:excisionase family DNA binding protein
MESTSRQSGRRRSRGDCQQEGPGVPQTKPKPRSSNRHPTEVLNLAEAASYLRIAPAEVLRMVREQGLPGREVADDWRFLKAAVQDWLRTGPDRTGKEAQLTRAGAWKDDPYIAEELKEIYRRRGRPMNGEEP